MIGENAVKVDDILQVFDSESSVQQNACNSSDLIGRTVSGLYLNDGEYEEITGEVTGVGWENNVVCVYIGDIKIPLDGITSIK
jgi:hypothetical protein